MDPITQGINFNLYLSVACTLIFSPHCVKLRQCSVSFLTELQAEEEIQQHEKRRMSTQALLTRNLSSPAAETVSKGLRNNGTVMKGWQTQL